MKVLLLVLALAVVGSNAGLLKLLGGLGGSKGVGYSKYGGQGKSYGGNYWGRGYGDGYYGGSGTYDGGYVGTTQIIRVIHEQPSYVNYEGYGGYDNGYGIGSYGSGYGYGANHYPGGQTIKIIKVIDGGYSTGAERNWWKK